MPPPDHPAFYCASDFTLNITRGPMAAAGFCPSGRLFEAAACGVPLLSDYWPGLDAFFTPGEEILVADTPDDVVGYLTEVPRRRLAAIGRAARRRVLAEHSAERRARQLEAIVGDLVGAR
jgi:spore maturation protein CgeB